MGIDEFAKLAGVLGFFISLATFALTRWERRVVLDFGLDPGDSSDFEETPDEPKSTVNLSITNLGARPALVDLRTLEIRSNGNALHAGREDYWGRQHRELLLKPNDTHKVGIPLETFVQKLRIESPRHYDDKSFNLLIPVQVRLSTTDGKVHTSKRLKYWEATGEFHRA